MQHFADRHWLSIGGGRIMRVLADERVLQEATEITDGRF
jgi:hypothetical protein